MIGRSNPSKKNDDWRLEASREFARKMMATCVPCPDGCGAMVCGAAQQKTHNQFHNLVNKIREDRDKIQLRLTQIENKLRGAEAQLNQNSQTIGQVTQMVLAVEGRAAAIEGKDQEQDQRLYALDGKSATAMGAAKLSGTSNVDLFGEVIPGDGG